MSARFLIVEDDASYAENLAEILGLLGYSSEHAGTAAEARVLAATHPFDVVLVDLGLPDARGNDLVAELRARAPNTIAVVLTDQPSLRSARDTIRSGAMAYVLKDEDPRELEATLRRAAEQALLGRALRESERRYALLVERAPLGIALVRDGCYTFANERFARIYGLADAAALVGAPVESVYAPSEHSRVREHWRLDREPWEETYVKTAMRRTDGATIDLLVTRSRLEVDGKEAIQLVVRDVTEENRLTRELEEARRQIEDKKRLAALGEMVAGIAHEVRNPLQGVSWGINDLKAHGVGRDEAGREALAKIERSTREIEAIVAEVLDFARPMKLDRIAFPVHELLESVRDDIAATAESAAISLEVVASGSNVEIEIDALKVKQALVNLARNAVEASPKGSRVSLRTESAATGGVVFFVDDEGSGIPPELSERIFLPFVTTKVKGTGLGLPIVRRIAEAHGGTIRFESREPRGTRARLELPA